MRRTAPRFWFMPCESGDFRLRRDGEGCVLSVVDPTPDDVQKLAPFLSRAVELGWVDAGIGTREEVPAREADERGWLGKLRDAFLGAEDQEVRPYPTLTGVHPTGETILPVRAGIVDAGPLLAAATFGDARTWTAVRCEGGKVIVDDGSAVPAETPAPVEAAATVRAPKRGCPEPTACERRASQVLRTFSTTRQWAQWEREARMLVIGNVTGRRYLVHHRDEAHHRRLSRSVLDVETGGVVCAWDDQVPAEEEALALKLALEHRETWLLQRPAELVRRRETWLRA